MLSCESILKRRKKYFPSEENSDFLHNLQHRPIRPGFMHPPVVILYRFPSFPISCQWTISQHDRLYFAKKPSNIAQTRFVIPYLKLREAPFSSTTDQVRTPRRRIGEFPNKITNHILVSSCWKLSAQIWTSPH